MTPFFPFVVGEDEEVSIKEVTDAIVKALKFEGQYTVSMFLACFANLHQLVLQFDITRADGQFRKPASNKKLLGLLGGKFEFTPFEKALDESVQWFLANYQNARIGEVKA